MVDLIVLLFICIDLPISLMLAVFKGESRTAVAFVLFGLIACLVSAYVNTALFEHLKTTKFYMTVNVTPIVEKLAKIHLF